MASRPLTRPVLGAAVVALGLTVTSVDLGASRAVAASCPPPYDGQPASSTTLILQHSVGEYGLPNRASVQVSGVGAAQGDVRLVVDGVVRATIELDGSGGGSVLLPILRARQTHLVQAQYRQCTHLASSDSRFYSVLRADTEVAPDVVKRRKAVFKARVRATASEVPVASGRARFTLRRASGQRVGARVQRVRDGVARVNLKNLGRGRYKLRVTYTGAASFEPARRRVTTFRVH